MKVIVGMIVRVKVVGVRGRGGGSGRGRIGYKNDFVQEKETSVVIGGRKAVVG